MISFSHVSIWFGERKVLDNVSFTVNRGQTLCILGRSGVGKSVALRILMGFLQPHVGLHPRRRRGDQRPHRGGHAGHPQARDHGFSERRTLRLAQRARKRRLSLARKGGLAEDQIQQVVDRLIGLVGAEDVVDDLPASLSTGRKRAVAIARALAAQPEVVLYDEPTTMVDPIIARRLGDLIQRLKHQLGFTSIVVTHDMRFAERLADQVLFLDQGRASIFGPLKEFLAPPIRIFSSF